MNTTTFDTLKLAEKFITAGFEEKQAKAIAETFGNLAGDKLVTKEYLDYKLEAELSKLKAELFKWLIPILLGQVGVFALVVEFLLGR